MLWIFCLVASDVLAVCCTVAQSSVTGLVTIFENGFEHGFVLYQVFQQNLYKKYFAVFGGGHITNILFHPYPSVCY